MTYKEKEVTDEQALQNFLKDIKCLDELLPWTDKFNLFDVLKISRAEIRHSNMLGWFLDPNENHGFGDDFLKGIIQRIVENDKKEKYDVFKVLLMDFYSFKILREWKNIDILLISQTEKTLIAIENKIGSHEHSDQLNRYRKILEHDYSDYNKILIYLTPDGEEPSDKDNWDILTYDDVVEVLEEIHSNRKVQPDVEIMIRNYIGIIRRDIVEDKLLVEICNKIYNKHKKALDLIFANRIEGKNQVSDAICNALKKLNDEGKIIYESGWGFSFRTRNMDEVLPLLDVAISSWNSTNIYSYWFNYKEGRFHCIFELAGLNVPEESKKIMQKMIDIMKPNDKRRNDFTYKRLYRSKWYDINDVEDVDEEVEYMVRSAVSEMLSMEEELLKQLQITG